MQLTVYHYPNCGTCRKAIQWLEAQGHVLNKVHIVDHPPERAELAAFIRRSGKDMKAFLNTSGQVYREAGIKALWPDWSEEERLNRLAANGKLLKRPIVTDGHVVTVGFKEEDYQQAWGG